MSPEPAVELRTFTTLEDIRTDLIGTYADVRAPLLHLPHYSVAA